MDFLQSGFFLQNKKYKIERVLGSGGFGITYLGIQVGLNRKVAIKEFFVKEYCVRDNETMQVVVPSQNSESRIENLKSKFIKEACSIANLSHEHIVRIFDVFQENETAYYVMDYLSGGSLNDYVLNKGALSEDEAVGYISQVASALEYIHSKHLLHLDVKPDNIMLNSEGKAILVDFGTSKRYDDVGTQTSSTFWGASACYAPIEVHEQGGVDKFMPCADIYSLGGTLYFLITGKNPPFASSILSDGMPDFPLNVSERIRNCIFKSMQPARNLRIKSVSEFMKYLSEDMICTAEDGEHTLIVDEVGVVSASEKVVGNSRYKVPVMAWVGLALVCVFLIGIFLFRGNGDTQSSKKQTITNQEKQDSVIVLNSNRTQLEQKDKSFLFAEKQENHVNSRNRNESGETKEVSTSKEETSNIKNDKRPLVLDQSVATGDRIMSVLPDIPVVKKENLDVVVAGVSFKMIYVEGGVFMMGGSNKEVAHVANDEKPVHKVALDGYYLAETEVTQKLWTAVMGNNPSYYKGDNLPVENVSWNDCMNFIKKLNSLSGKQFVLPTEAQWEFAARGGRNGNMTLYSGGNDFDEVLWCKSNSEGATKVVKQKKPNELGLYDMSGNVWEWCSDFYGIYPNGSVYNPRGITTGVAKVYRGGSWRTSSILCRVSYRGSSSPNEKYNNLGLRLAINL